MADRILRKEAIGMFKIYPDDQVVRGVRRAYPEEETDIRQLI